MPYKPIMLSRDDKLTIGTACQILDHNVLYWCKNPAEQPAGFDKRYCEPGVPACQRFRSTGGPVL